MNSKDAYRLTLKTGMSNLELELAISQNCHYSYIYAKKILKDKFELGEKIISKNCHCSLLYAIEILKSRFKLGENLIQINSRYSYNYPYEYCCEVLKYNHE